MIDSALIFLRDQLNAHLKTWHEESRDAIELTPVVKANGESALTTRVGLALVNVEEERVNKAQARQVVSANGIATFIVPEIRLNLHVMVVARATGSGKPYEEALKSLSAVATYFQSHRSFEARSYPALRPEIDTLIVELEPVDYEAQNNIWGALGGEMLPSLHYRVRLVTIQQGVVDETGKVITEIDSRGLS